MNLSKAVILSLSLLAPFATYADHFNDSDTAPTDPGNRKIVVFEPGTTNDEKEQILKGAACSLRKHLLIINAASIHYANAFSLSNLGMNPKVKRVEDDLIYQITVVPGSIHEMGKGKPTEPQPTQDLAKLWGINRVKAPDAWALSQGAGVNVCVIDTGIDLTHPDLAANIRGGFNAINSRKSANDDNGHGTHVAGTIAALNNTIGVIGVGPLINLFAVKVLNAQGMGFLSDIIEGVQWCAQNGGRVASLSLGSSSDSAAFKAAIEAAYNAGVTIVAAAGNESGAVIYPAKYPQVIAVSALDSNDHLASFSNFGPEVDLTAPGVGVLSTWKGSSYATASGTSMATPHVSGSAALKLALLPSLTPDGVATALKSTADFLPGLTSDQQGAGLVNCQTLVSK